MGDITRKRYHVRVGDIARVAADIASDRYVCLEVGTGV